MNGGHGPTKIVCKTSIGVYLIMYLMHPNYGHAIIARTIADINRSYVNINMHDSA